jgi:putative transposase
MVRSNQCTSALHQALLARHGLVGSRTQKGNGRNTEVVERLIQRLKPERV